MRAFEFKPKKKKIEFDQLPVKPTGIPAKPAGKPVGSQMHWDLTGLPEPECSGLRYPVGKKKPWSCVATSFILSLKSIASCVNGLQDLRLDEQIIHPSQHIFPGNGGIEGQ